MIVAKGSDRKSEFARRLINPAEPLDVGKLYPSFNSYIEQAFPGFKLGKDASELQNQQSKHEASDQTEN
jgi:hypothetical protein